MKPPSYESVKKIPGKVVTRLPSHWDAQKLKFQVSKVGSGVTPKGGAESYEQEGIPLLRSQNVYFDGLRLDDVVFISEQVHAEMSNSQVEAGDVLLNITGASIGRCYYADDALGDANVNQHVCIVRPDRSLSTRFLFYVLCSNVGQNQIDLEQSGSGREGLNFSSLKNFSIPIVPPNEQQQIADFLDWKTGQIDRLIAKKRALVQSLSEKRMAIITQAVTRGLDSTVPMKDSGSPWLGKMPKHWRIMRFGYQTRVKEGQVDPEIEPYVDQPLIAPNHIESNTGRIICLESARDQAAISGKYQVSKGDIVYSKIRPHLNKCCLATFDGLCSADMYPIHPSDEMDSHFLLYWILATPFLDYAELNSMRVAMPKLNRETLSAAPLLVPPIDEQTDIRDFLIEETDHIDQLTEKTEAAIDRLTEYRTALITAATTGKIDVRDVEIPGQSR
ncbi:restriction endonuclease subunit S [Aporhodopirellula aestuarii]|uniref:Restriction endonuclease subunit S n=1 Tax=Aporhodopirellula aestuarii TaxID=2950107 RepID=A0ABT0U1V0_9BACT|nr:restriction endonuclease subunit S [Aporhodopirellula aestuarii]MCM2370830.1 restriction endonuclease subunit S [Aporhodopirellula aestuarii]